MRARRFAACWALALACVGTTFAADQDARRSGFDFMSPQTKAMQQDDTSNPAMLWVSDGEALWNQQPGAGQRACSSCHAAAAMSMRGVAAAYPRFDSTLLRPLDLRQRVNVCRTKYQHAPQFPPESHDLLSLEAFVAMQSRGLPIRPDSDPRVQPFRERGAALYKQRIGQLDLSCSACHDTLAGRRLGSAVIPQAHPTGYPIYRLEWQGLGSLQRRLRGCMSGVRAEPFAFDAPEMIELELYLMQRAAGMPLETPAVRP